MKHQQVVPDYVAMMKTSGTWLCLVFSGWVLFKLVQAIFWLPGYLEKNQGRLYERMEPRSGLARGGVEKQDGPPESVAESNSKDNRNTAAEDELDEAKERAPGSGEKGENDAIECEPDSKKDK